MAVKTFTDSTALPASDINTFLANGGLVYVSSTTIGSGVTSVTVSNAFSATYDAYKIMVTGGAGSGTSYLNFRLGTSGGPDSGSVYQESMFYTTLTSTPLAVGQTATNMSYIGAVTTTGIMGMLELANPYLASKTLVYAPVAALGSFVGMDVCIVNTNTQYTHFTVYANAGTLTGGTITVYGYRKA